MILELDPSHLIEGYIIYNINEFQGDCTRRRFYDFWNSIRHIDLDFYVDLDE